MVNKDTCSHIKYKLIVKKVKNVKKRQVEQSTVPLKGLKKIETVFWLK